ncbi:MAG: hypothetical protein LBV16_00680 [Elusimicrobiota bacterium]|jgi:hypothetical protein|nr:hypothetical protein [Elusimicrobiota bacterium]
MPFYFCPENIDENILIENHKKAQNILNCNNSRNAAAPIDNIIAKRQIIDWKLVEHTTKQIIRDFFKIIAVLFSPRRQNSAYVAFIPRGDMGDLIRETSILVELVKMSPSVIVDIYGHTSKLKPIFIGIKNIRYFFHEHSFKILRNCYDLIYSFSDVDCAKIDFIKAGKELTDKIIANKQEYTAKFLTPINCINKLKISAAVDNVYDDKLLMSYKTKSLKKFGIKPETKYITFQQAATDKGTMFHAKCWSNDNWLRFIEILNNNMDKDIKIVRVGIGGGGISGYNIIDTMKKTSFNELCSIIKNSLLHIDIDGGCVHIAKALGTKALVLWGVTPGDYIGYDNNINIASSMCRYCWDYHWTFHCVFGEAHQKCIQSIAPEFAAQKAIEYLRTILK